MQMHRRQHIPAFDKKGLDPACLVKSLDHKSEEYDAI